MAKRILFLVPYPLKESPSQRFRFEQYFELLLNNGFQFEVHSFLKSHNWKIFFKSGQTLAKILALGAGFFNRVLSLFHSLSYDFVFIHRELTPLGPPVFEWMLAKILRRKIIYDFDDAIWLTDRNEEPRLLKLLKYRSKVKSICRWSYKVSCGNEYLGDFAGLYNKRVVFNPTTIETQARHNPDLKTKISLIKNRITIGWTGSHSTLKYLDEIEPVLQKLENKFPMVQVLVIADRKPLLKLNSLLFIPWREKSEIDDLLKIDIGIMPLPDDEWTKGKCGFKALQYMALRIPTVASPVGVNSKIIDHGVNGFLCNTPEEWENALTELIENNTLRSQMGEEGRKKVINHYSVTSNSDNFLSLFE